MFVEAAEFRDPSGMFPRFIASITFLGALVLLLEPFLPAPLRAVVSESGDVFDSYEEEIEEVEAQTEEMDDMTTDREPTVDSKEECDNETSAEAVTGATDERQFESHSILPSPRAAMENKRFVLSVMTAGYVVLCYLISFLFASPVFVFAYSYWVDHDWYITVGLTAGAFGIVYGFMGLLNVQLNSGVLVG
ncbi:hypothetical protein [Natrialba asiatica]|uniref:Uncharacterized protein n=1 Tax=Natrialba asiatica (strain ATCC 700177 / DSM 12278 / JCM 9576 / FERM P-10747 / NBRC 102637 / 172P1) TaxID=29540 RepID=M0AEX5_NATA1|nr:hypothetical protein [Natrialba asiatica]ELY97069.1 hypothetical protein C481_20781 [Natrialba asiatica DSM 12278]